MLGELICAFYLLMLYQIYPHRTDSGPTYLSPDQPTIPPDAIRRIRSNFPNDPRSPFYDPTGAEMKPLARLYLSRQRLYERDCSKRILEDNSQSHPCATNNWGNWSKCTSNCGRNVHEYRHRSYLNPMLASANNCDKKITQVFLFLINLKTKIDIYPKYFKL